MPYPNTIPAGTLVIPGGGVTVNNNPNNPQTYDQLTLAQSNLAFYYPLNDTSGTPVDKTGNTTIVSTSGSPVLQAPGGTVDGATGVQFPNGSGYTLNVAGVDTTKRFSYDFIISLPDINNDRNYFEIAQQYNGFISPNGPNAPNFGIYVYGANTSYNSYGKFDALNTFVHIGGTYDPVSETAVVWVNGQRYTSFYAPRSTATSGATSFPLINSSVGINNGIMQKFAVYSGALNDSYFEAKARAAFYQPTTVLTGQIVSNSNLGYAATVLLDNPEVYYRFSESSSNIAYDSSGNSNNGTCVNTPIFGAVSLVGDINDKSINTNNISYITSSTLPNVSAFTIELVVQLTGGLTFARIFATDVYNSSNGFCIVFNQGNADALPTGFNITFNTTGSSISNTTVANSFAISQSKLHIAMSYDGTTLKFYVNGALAYSNVLSGTYKPSTSYSVVAIGNDPAGQSQFSGFLDEYALYNTVLSQTRIQAHAAACFGAR